MTNPPGVSAEEAWGSGAPSFPVSAKAAPLKIGLPSGRLPEWSSGRGSWKAQLGQRCSLMGHGAGHGTGLQLQRRSYLVSLAATAA